MNELMIIFTSGDYIYFKTDQKTADKAFDEFLEVCENANINIDNMNFAKCELRNKEQETIDIFNI